MGLCGKEEEEEEEMRTNLQRVFLCLILILCQLKVVSAEKYGEVLEGRSRAIVAQGDEFGVPCTGNHNHVKYREKN